MHHAASCHQLANNQLLCSLLAVYDDYKFVTSKELESLGLSNLVGSNLLRAYMHGYFIDMRLYSKVQPLIV